MKALHTRVAANIGSGLAQLAVVQAELARHYRDLADTWRVLVACQQDIDRAVGSFEGVNRFSRARVEAIQVAAARLPRHLECANRDLRAVKARVRAANTALTRAQGLRSQALMQLERERDARGPPPFPPRARPPFPPDLRSWVWATAVLLAMVCSACCLVARAIVP